MCRNIREISVILSYHEEIEALKEQKNEEMLTRMEEMRQKMVDSSQLSVGRLKIKLEKEQDQKILKKEDEMKILNMLMCSRNIINCYLI